jgi:hypothetical protein
MAQAASAPHSRIHEARDPYLLRPLPGEDLRIEFKPINNSRLVREPDPKARGACWSAIAVTAITLVFLSGVLAPRLLNTLAGYRLEALRAENRRLLDERRTLDLREAELTSPERLQELAQRQHMVVPNSTQVVRLDVAPAGSGDSTVAMIH